MTVVLEGMMMMRSNRIGKWREKTVRQDRRRQTRLAPRSRAMIDALRPLQLHAGRELDVTAVHVFDEIDDATGQISIAIGLMTKSGTRTVMLPVGLAAQLGENLLWLTGRRACRPGTL